MNTFLETLNRYQDNKLIRSKKHPILDLTIWSYTEKVQYEQLWDNITLQARGLITDGNGEIVAKGFNKFFSYEEVQFKNDIPWNEQVLIQEKVDGSLGIIFFYKDRWIVATRGSFTSDQALKAEEILHKQLPQGLDKKYSYLVEIIYKENKIVVDYGEVEKLIFLSVFDQNKELCWDTAYTILNQCGVKDSFIVHTQKNNSIHHKKIVGIKHLNLQNKEGFVLRFLPSNYRIKIKFEDYVQLHKLTTNISTIKIWEALKNNQDILSILETVPDELYEKIKFYVKKLKYKYQSTVNYVGKLFDSYCKNCNYNLEDKKKFANWVLKQEPQIQPILFNMLNHKDYSQIIWKLLKPKYKKI